MGHWIVISKGIDIIKGGCFDQIRLCSGWCDDPQVQDDWGGNPENLGRVLRQTPGRLHDQREFPRYKGGENSVHLIFSRPIWPKELLLELQTALIRSCLVRKLLTGQTCLGPFAEFDGGKFQPGQKQRTLPPKSIDFFTSNDEVSF